MELLQKSWELVIIIMYPTILPSFAMLYSKSLGVSDISY